jgi:hypothetical protein
MTLLQDLQSYQERRKFPDWQPVPSADRVPDKANQNPYIQVILRALDFLPLELQVAEWDREAQLIPELEEVESVLERNAQDETKHDAVLRHLSQHYNKRGIEDNEALSLISGWQASNAHPIVLTYALEMGVFFSVLPALIKYGNVYAATVAQWISDDERVHVETGLRLTKALGLKLTPAIVTSVFWTNEYIFKPLGDEVAKAQAERAVKRLISGKDKQMLTESLPVTIAFFEQHDKRSIVY